MDLEEGTGSHWGNVLENETERLFKQRNTEFNFQSEREQQQAEHDTLH